MIIGVAVKNVLFSLNVAFLKSIIFASLKEIILCDGIQIFQGSMKRENRTFYYWLIKG